MGTSKNKIKKVSELVSWCFKPSQPQKIKKERENMERKGRKKEEKAPKTDHITPHLRTLHWLPIDARIKYKLCSLCSGAITSTGPIYLSDLPKIYTPSRQLRSSADIRILCIPSVNTKPHGERSFSYTSPTLEHSSKRHKIFSVSFFL